MLAALVSLNAITALVCIVMLALLLKQPPPADAPETFLRLDVWEAAIRETIAAELTRCREEVRAASSELRHDVTAAVDALGRTLGTAYANVADADRERLEVQLHALTAFVADSTNRVSHSFDTRLATLQETLDALRKADRHQP